MHPKMVSLYKQGQAAAKKQAAEEVAEAGWAAKRAELLKRAKHGALDIALVAEVRFL